MRANLTTQVISYLTSIIASILEVMSGQKERLVHHLVVRMVTVTLQGSLPTHAQLDLETEME